MTPLERRRAALSLIGKSWSDHSPLDEALSLYFESKEVKKEDRAWLMDVVSGTTRFRGRLEWILEQVSDKGAPTGRLRRALLVGLYQVLEHDRVAPAVVVEETVEWIKKTEGIAPSRFANAILRKVAAQLDQWKSWDETSLTTEQERAAFFSCPLELYRALIQDRGRDWAEAFLRASLKRPEIHFNVRPGSNAVPSDLASEWSDTRDYFVQDLSSQFLVRQFSNSIARACVPREPREIRVLDLCASPGGKAVALAWKGFTVQASEFNEKRRPLLEMNVERLAPSVEVIPYPKDLSAVKVDALWIDAPCSGLGVIGRHPEAKWNRKLSDIREVEKIQSKLLNDALSRTQAKQVLYSVCSVLKREGEDQVQAALKRHPAWKLSREWALSPTEPPHGDGFYAAILASS